MRSSEMWARSEFASLHLGDQRREARTVALATSLAERPGGRVTQVLETPAEQEGAFRWVRNEAVDRAELMKASAAATVKRCAGKRFVFVALDQTSLGLVDKARTKGFGHVGRTGTVYQARGLQVMSALVVSEKGATLGLAGQAWWARRDEKSPEFRADRRPVEQRESSLWTRCLNKADESFASSPCRPWFQLDRGGDTYQVLTAAQHQDRYWVTARSAYNRRLETDEPTYLRDLKVLQRAAGYTTLRLNPRRARRLGRNPRRPVQLGLSFAKVTLRLSHPVTSRSHPMTCYVVRIRERRPPRTSQRLEWWLLTTYPVETFEDAKLVQHGYTLRWRVEEFHRTWKTGTCNVESSQLRSRSNFERWATLLAIVAARVERLKLMARNEPDTPAAEVLSRDEIDAAILVSKTKKHRAGDDLRIADAVHLIALIGGYTGNTKAGPPGSITIRRGLERVETLALGIAIGREK